MDQCFEKRLGWKRYRCWGLRDRRPWFFISGWCFFLVVLVIAFFWKEIVFESLGQPTALHCFEHLCQPEHWQHILRIVYKLDATEWISTQEQIFEIWWVKLRTSQTALKYLPIIIVFSINLKQQESLFSTNQDKLLCFEFWLWMKHKKT